LERPSSGVANVSDDVWRMGVGLVAHVDYRHSRLGAQPLIETL
jgi:hypothetical protein